MDFKHPRSSSLILFLILFGLSIIDYCLTLEGLDSHKITEANPIMRYIIQNFSFWPGLLIKQGLVLLAIGLVFTKTNLDKVLYFGIFIYITVIGINLAIPMWY